LRGLRRFDLDVQTLHLRGIEPDVRRLRRACQQTQRQPCASGTLRKRKKHQLFLKSLQT